jgi:hypothetical protein
MDPTQDVSERSRDKLKPVPEPHERVAEVLFGPIMALTFTGSLRIAEAGRDDVRMMLIGALPPIVASVLRPSGFASERGTSGD